jgi:hypothetical protein
MVQVLQLPQQISLQIKLIDDAAIDPDFVMRWREPVEKVLAESIFTMDPIESVIKQCNEGVLGSLEHCSFVLHQFRPEPLARQDELSGIRQLINELDHELKIAKDISADVRAFLRAHVRAMSQALDDFAVMGSGGLQDEFDKMVGALVRRKDILIQVEAADSSEERSVWTKVWELLARVATVLSLSVSLLALGQVTHNQLQGDPVNPTIVVQIETPPNPADGGGPVSQGRP